VDLAGAALALRSLGVALALPLGSLAPRLLLGAATALWVRAEVGPGGTASGPAGTSQAMLGPLAAATELLLGLALGLLAGLPARVTAALRGPEQPEIFETLGHTLGWAVFFAVGGPALWLAGLSHSHGALPAGTWPDAGALVAAAGPLFGVALVLGLPTWVVALATAPLAGMVARVGADDVALGLRAAAWPVVTLLLWVALLPVALDWLADAWRAAWVPLIGFDPGGALGGGSGGGSGGGTGGGTGGGGGGG
jgi:flagellar biosynthesis protein FliR